MVVVSSPWYLSLSSIATYEDGEEPLRDARPVSIVEVPPHGPPSTSSHEYGFLRCKGRGACSIKESGIWPSIFLDRAKKAAEMLAENTVMEAALL